MQSVAQMLNLAVQQHQAGDVHQAESLYRQILQIDPQNVDALHMLGVLAHQAGKDDLAVDYILQALRLSPAFPQAYNNLGTALMAQGKLEEALASFRQALALKPDYVSAYANMGSALQDQDRLDDAKASYQQALRLKPDYAAAYINLGIAQGIQGKFDEAIASYRQALRLKPDYAEAYYNLGNALQDQGKLEEAMASYQQALRLKPDDADGHLNLAMVRLLMGDFSQGWPEFEWRWHTGLRRRNARRFSQPLWEGNPLREGTILLYDDGGLGDAIQFCRFADLVKQRVGTVLYECLPSLARLLRTCAGIDTIIPLGDPLPAYDVYAPIMSLPGILKTTLATIPAQVPYLMRDEASLPHASLLRKQEVCEDTPRLRGRLAVRGRLAFRVGIAWQGNPMTCAAHLQRADRRRSVPLAQFESLARVPGVRLFSLQKCFGTEQLDKLAGRFPITDLGSTCEDLSDTAAVMKTLDLVISIDSSPAHLAGALGVPVWVPLPFIPEWRWLMDREDSPWYPTMRLFRQTSPGNWADVFERMARELAG